MAALADRPGFRLSDWAVFTADDIIETRGYPALLALMRQAKVVLLADERPTDIAVEGTKPLVTLVGITSDPQLDRLETDVPTDQSAETGSLDDLTNPIPQPQSTSSSSGFSVRSPRRAAIWARVLASPLAATIEARVDGRRVGAVTPVTLGKGGFEWVRVTSVPVAAGTHRITLTAVPSRFGDEYEVEEARVLDPDALRIAEWQLSRSLAGVSSRVAYSFNLADVAKWAGDSLAPRLRPAKASAFSRKAWKALPKAVNAVTATSAPGGAIAPQFTAQWGRSVYAFAKISYKKPRNWAGSPYIYFYFKGTDSHKVYEVVFDFGLGPSNEARYTITDDSRGWRTLAFSTADPGLGSGFD